MVETDKSSRFSVMDLQTYPKAGDKHVENDQEIYEKELRLVQRRVNAA